MPKVILGEENRRHAALLAYIDDHVGRGRQFRYDADLAAALKMEYHTFYGKRRMPHRFTFDDLCALLRVTNGSGDDARKIFGLKK